LASSSVEGVAPVVPVVPVVSLGEVIVPFDVPVGPPVVPLVPLDPDIPDVPVVPVVPRVAVQSGSVFACVRSQNPSRVRVAPLPVVVPVVPVGESSLVVVPFVSVSIVPDEPVAPVRDEPLVSVVVPDWAYAPAERRKAQATGEINFDSLMELS
jgi:hypothetical protein